MPPNVKKPRRFVTVRGFWMLVAGARFELTTFRL